MLLDMVNLSGNSGCPFFYILDDQRPPVSPVAPPKGAEKIFSVTYRVRLNYCSIQALKNPSISLPRPYKRPTTAPHARCLHVLWSAHTPVIHQTECLMVRPSSPTILSWFTWELFGICLGVT